jgi:hypothetical protein
LPGILKTNIQSMKVSAKVNNGRLPKVISEQIRKRLEASEGKFLSIEIKQERPISLQQYGFLYGVIYPVIRSGIEAYTGETFSIEDVDQMMKLKFLFSEIIDFETGEITKVLDRKSKLNKSELADYITNVMQFGETTLNVKFPAEFEQDYFISETK